MNSQHSGRIGQMIIYVGKLFRMFIFQNDWKVLPMAAVIAALVAYVVGDYLFKDMVNTMLGSFALSSVCIWNGFFNSIQSICRERPIIKREHRAGMHISSYVAAHMIYQAFICICQSLIIVVILNIARVQFPERGILFGDINIDMGVAMFLTTYAADMIALFISAIVKNTTSAMTVMPFVMIFQLVFAGILFPIPDSVSGVSDFTISKWSLTAFCAEGNYNALPNNAMLSALESMDTGALTLNEEDIAATGMSSGVEAADLSVMLETMKEYAGNPEYRDLFAQKCGELSYNADYESTPNTVANCYVNLTLSIIFFSVLSVITLEFIDRDKR